MRQAIERYDAEGRDATLEYYNDPATADGRWVDYFFDHPDTGQPEQKHSWVVRHDGLFFGSGWYTVRARHRLTRR